MVTVVDMNDKMIIDDIPVGVEPEGMGLTNNGKNLSQYIRNNKYGSFH